ncbi:hypothetical protein [Bacillus pinisoli]|uniref:hypothetical protein n=1 Tax=Bacillus pinisoli TaxID=2901866 RepID=UPI001FF46BB2|nr:hypothetical protein [Bacillus pinisoli]
MSGYTITKKKRFDLSSFLIMTSIILVLSCLIVPFVAIYTYQDIFINNVPAWFFTTPKYNYFIFAGALTWFSILIILFVIYRNHVMMSDKKLRILPFLLLAIPGCIVIVLSLNNYFYLNDEGIHTRSMADFSVKTYKWEDVTEAKQLQIIRDGVMFEGDMVFTFKDGESFNLPVTKEVQLNKRRIYTALREFNIEVQRIQPGQ